MKLYEIAAEYDRFLEVIENSEITDEAIADTLESIVAELEEKADNIACVIKNLIAEADAIKVEEQKLAERRKAKENRVKSLKEYLSNTLQDRGFSKIETARNKITFRKSESVEVTEETAFIEWAEKNNKDYLSYKAPTINKTMIKQALAEGKEIEGAYIKVNQNIQIK